MRRRMRAAALVLALVLALGTVAAATDTTETTPTPIDYNTETNTNAKAKNGIQVAPLNSQNCKVEFKDNSSEALTVTYTNDDLNEGDMVIVLFLATKDANDKSVKVETKEDAEQQIALTNKTIQYIDQADVTEAGTVTFHVFPQNYSNGVIRVIWKDQTSDSVNTATVAAVNRTYKLGDVNDDGLVNGVDVSDILLYVVGKRATINKYAADVSGDGLINAVDVSDILLYVAKNIPFKAKSN